MVRREDRCYPTDCEQLFGSLSVRPAQHVPEAVPRVYLRPEDLACRANGVTVWLTVGYVNVCQCQAESIYKSQATLRLIAKSGGLS